MLKLACCLLAVACVSADIYMHNPRGSNNRLNERSANRANGNRAFDSQNNNRGGYNVGDATDEAAQNEAQQYQMKFFQSGANAASHLTVEWTNQHGCGGNEDDDPHKVNCNIVIQYMCQPAEFEGNAKDRLRDGLNTNRQDYARPRSNLESRSAFQSRKNNNVKDNRVLFETFDWYDKCFVRERNKGLFTADQNLRTNNGLGVSSAIYTRQNRNGDRRGYECPEERDYYPYWHPTPWKDIAILAENATICSHYTKKSFNVQHYGECVEYYDDTQTVRRHSSKYNSHCLCETVPGNRWVDFYNYLEKAPQYDTETKCIDARLKDNIEYIWQIPYDSVDAQSKECLVPLPEPECMEAPWTRVNHNGNTRDGVASNYTWTLPYFPSGSDQRCILRVRYNISTDDYDPYNTDHTSNRKVVGGTIVRESPITGNPTVDIGAGLSPLRLNINTAQFGRTFQDRSHVFHLKPRPTELADKTIYNLNVRGKRGNIVQTYPAVEYDFIPNDLTLKANDVVHLQWTGSNTHNNGNPAGDGQAGDAGQGKGGTDRHNFVQILDRNHNFPAPFEATSMWDNTEVVWAYSAGLVGKNPLNTALNVATSGYYECSTECSESVGSKDNLQAQLNNAAASFEGLVLKMSPGKYHYMSTRNNAFTNRSQKGTITVVAA
ncbi:protein DD3-3 [Lingula anatina]|uniref:Protein DD3-3 n=1 Tax=Lingula anatina TaxID=7574 RepID=A0A1S3I1H7_LINAN|nr:protein DD3-3 [Lingula anatina]|eukprot:XP_013392122.1 protein DD3-3 [Lingula anatina]